MSDVFADAAHLRELAAKCRRLASSLTDPNDVAAFRQMAIEYQGMADRIEHPLIPGLPPPIQPLGE